MEPFIFACRAGSVVAFLLVAFSGWRLFLLGRRRAGNAALAFSLGALSVLSLVPFPRPPGETVVVRVATSVDGAPSTVDRRLITVDTRPWPVDSIVASANPQKNTYHKADGCGHARQIRLPARVYAGAAEAEAAGLRPCGNCFRDLYVGIVDRP